MKNNRSNKQNVENSRYEIMCEILAVQREMSIALQNLDFAEDFDNIDVASHKITLAQSRYDRIIKKARDIKLDYSFM